MDLYDRKRLATPNLKYANSSSNYYVMMMLQNLKKVLKSKMSNVFLISEARSAVLKQIIDYGLDLEIYSKSIKYGFLYGWSMMPFIMYILKQLTPLNWATG